MWTFVVRITSECDEDNSVESAPIEILSKDVHMWPLISLDGYDIGYNELRFDFILKCEQGSMLVHTIKVPTKWINHFNVPEKKASLRRLDDLTRVSVTRQMLDVNAMKLMYVAYSYNKLEECIGQIHIHDLVLLFNVNRFLNKEGHKITCMVNDNYLGRAQVCITNTSERFLKWKPSPGEWMSPRASGNFNQIMQDNEDLKLIRMADPSGLYKKVVRVKEMTHVPDNDAFSNPIYRLKPRVENGETLRISIYNFKFTPPRCVQCTVKWADFENSTCLVMASPRNPTPRKWFRRKQREALLPPPRVSGIIEKKLLKDLTLKISYFMEKDCADIESLRLHAENYNETLDMTEMQNPKTI